jgi:hypothetical protein
VHSDVLGSGLREQLSLRKQILAFVKSLVKMLTLYLRELPKNDVNFLKDVA